MGNGLNRHDDIVTVDFSDNDIKPSISQRVSNAFKRTPKIDKDMEDCDSSKKRGSMRLFFRSIANRFHYCQYERAHHDSAHGILV
jgi:hypothetical protein